MLSTAKNIRWYSAGLGWALGCLWFFAALRCEAQNLVPNPSFELIDSCPQFPATGFQPGAVPQYWYSSSDTPDYFNACEDTVTDVPHNIFTYQLAFDGNAYSGLWSQLPNDYREMIGVELLSPLVVGQSYFASFYANAAHGGTQPTGLLCNNIGMLFCMQPYYWLSGWPEFGLRNYAHVWSTAVISDTSNWVLVSGSFVADSAYRFMVVGNHFDNANTVVDSLTTGLQWAYLVVDQLCVSANALGCPMATAVEGQQVDEVAIFPNPAQEMVRVVWGSGQVEHLKVTDTVGRLIWQAHSEGSDRALLDVADWARGHYVLTLEGDVRRSFMFVLVE